LSERDAAAAAAGPDSLEAALERIHAAIERGELAAAAQAAEALAAAHTGVARARALSELGFAWGGMGRHKESLRVQVEASELFRQAGDATGSADALTGIANGLRVVGDHAAAISMFEQAEALARAADDPLRVARALRGIGVASSLLGRHQHAVACLEEATQLLLQHGSAEECRIARLSLLNAHNRRLETDADGQAVDREAAERLLAAWRDLADEAAAAGHARIELMARGNHAITLQPLGRVDEAAAELHSLLPRYLAHGMRPNAGLTHSELGRCHLKQGDAEAARGQFQRALDVQRDSGSHGDLITTWDGLSRALEQLGDAAAALAALREVRRLEAERSAEAARQALVQRELRIELARLTSRWAREASLDPLTGLGNRRALDAWLTARWPGTERGERVTVLLLDLDHFKRVNDTFGHDTGDRVLRETATLLQAHCRHADLAVRYGGEEFLLAMSGAERSAAEVVAERVRTAIAAHDWARLADGLVVTTSVGLADGAEVLDAAALLTLADRRLYAAKYGGRNRTVVRD
jgi:diguanylate cyclase (GGDEF)-like protein